MMRIALIFLTALYATITTAQIEQGWIGTYSGPSTGGSHHVLGMKVDDKGNTYIISLSYGGLDLGYDIALIRHNPDGSTAWVSRYNHAGAGYEAPYAVDLDTSGNVYVTGRVFDHPKNWNFLTLKFDKNGNLQWNQVFESISIDNYFVTNDLVVDPHGNIFVCGSTYDQDSILGTQVIQYDPDGGIRWSRFFSDSLFFDFQDMQVDAVGNIYVAGNGFTGSAIVKYDNDGKLIFVAQRPEGTFGDISSIKVDRHQQIYVAGTGQHGYTATRFNTLGIHEWTRIHGISGNSSTIDIDSKGNVYVSGTAWLQSTPSVGRDITTVKFDSSGNELWTRYVDGELHDDDWGEDLKVTRDDHIIVTGTRDEMYYTVAYHPDGNMLWEQTYDINDSTDCESNVIGFDCMGNVYISGHCNYRIGYQYIPDIVTTIQYRRIDPLTCPGDEEEQPDDLTVLPNLTDYYVLVSGIREEIVFKLYNILGIEVLSTQLTPPAQPITFHELPPGMYAYVLGNKVKVGKIIIQ